MKNAQNTSSAKDTGKLFIHSFLLITALLLSSFAFADSLAAVDTSSITATEIDTATAFVPVPEEKIMGISSGLFWTYLAMSLGLIFILCLAYFTSVSKDKKGGTKK